MLSTLVAASCKNTSSVTSDREGKAAKVAVPDDSLDAALDALDPDLVVARNADGYYLGMVAGAGGTYDSPAMAALRSIGSAAFAVYSPDDELIESQSTDALVSSGLPGGNGADASLTMTAGITWEPRGSVAPGTYVVMTVRSPNGIVRRRMPIVEAPVDRAPASRSIVMSLDTRDRDGGVDFILTVERVAPPPPGEYLPSGERYRIDIYGRSGETVWSSSSGRMFTQAIASVLPKEVGERIEYREFWDGRNVLTHARLDPGTYRIVATIPAKPTPYILREEFTWSGH